MRTCGVVGKESKQPLNERQNKIILFLMRANGPLSMSQLERKLENASRRTLQRDLNYLIQHQLVEIFGAARQTHYRLAPITVT